MQRKLNVGPQLQTYKLSPIERYKIISVLQCLQDEIVHSNFVLHKPVLLQKHDVTNVMDSWTHTQ